MTGFRRVLFRSAVGRHRPGDSWDDVIDAVLSDDDEWTRPGRVRPDPRDVRARIDSLPAQAPADGDGDTAEDAAGDADLTPQTVEQILHDVAAAGDAVSTALQRRARELIRDIRTRYPAFLRDDMAEVVTRQARSMTVALGDQVQGLIDDIKAAAEFFEEGEDNADHEDRDVA